MSDGNYSGSGVLYSDDGYWWWDEAQQAWQPTNSAEGEVQELQQSATSLETDDELDAFAKFIASAEFVEE